MVSYTTTHRTRWRRHGADFGAPSSVEGLQVWFQAEHSFGHGKASDNDVVTLWEPMVDNTGMGVELEDQGHTDPTVDTSTMGSNGREVISIDAGTASHTRSIGMRDTEADWENIICGENEANAIVFTFRCDDVTDASIFSCLGGGASSVGSSGYRGFDFRINNSKIDARRKDTDNSARTTAGITIANNTDYVVCMVFEHGEDKIHLFVDGSSHAQYYSQYVDLGGKSAKPTGGDTANLNIQGINSSSNTSWTVPAMISDYLIYHRQADFTNSEVNKIGSYLANRSGATWTDITELAT